MSKGITINEAFINGLDYFMKIASKEEMLDTLDELSGTLVRSGVINEYGLSKEIGFLFDIKNLIKVLPERS